SLVTDVFSKAKRSWVMSRIRGKDTGPERRVRSFLHRHGFRFSLHKAALPGKPDVVLPKHRTVVFVNGCFFHGHLQCDKGRKRPSSRVSFWNAKIDGNARRDRAVARQLRRTGWHVITVWECETANERTLERRLLG